MGSSTNAACIGMQVNGMELRCYELFASGNFGHFFEDRFPCRSLAFLRNVSG